jgi:hypothetical protein
MIPAQLERFKMTLNLFMLAGVSLATGFAIGWSLRAALARADQYVTMTNRSEEIVDLEWVGSPWTNMMGFYTDLTIKEYFKARGDRS